MDNLQQGSKEQPDTLAQEQKMRDNLEYIGLPSSPLNFPYHILKLPENNHHLGLSAADCFAVVLDDVLRPDECKRLVEQAEPHLTYRSEILHEENGHQYLVPIENPQRYRLAKFVDKPLAEVIWQRIRRRIEPVLTPFVSRSIRDPPVGINPRLRILCYSVPEDEFRPHFDRLVDEDDGSHSLITVLIFLTNGGGIDFHGGETIFLDTTDSTRNPVAVVPKAGRAVIFEHGLYHTGSSLLEPYTGSKVIMRTDVMFHHPTYLAAARCEDETVQEMLTRLQLLHLFDNFEVLGFLNERKDTFQHLGEMALREMLLDLEISEDEVDQIIEASFSSKSVRSEGLIWSSMQEIAT